MIPLNKLLKIALPVTTVTSATILTAWLISRSPELLNQEQDKDLLLNDFEEPVEEFIEKTLSESNGDDNKDDSEDKSNKSGEEQKEETEKPEAESDKDIDAVGLLNNMDKLKNMLRESPDIPEDSIKLPKELSTEPEGAQKPQEKELSVSGIDDSKKSSIPAEETTQKENVDSLVSENSSEQASALPKEQEDRPQSKDGERALQEIKDSRDSEAGEHPLAQSEQELQGPSEGEAKVLNEPLPKGEHDSMDEGVSPTSKPDNKRDSLNDREDSAISSREEPSSEGTEPNTSLEEGQNKSGLEGAEESKTHGNSDRNNFDLSEFEKLAGDLDLADLGLDKVLN